MVQKSWTPEKLVAELQKSIIGQDHYLQDLCTAIWMHSLRKQVYETSGEFIFKPKTNILVLGKSGTGKTSAIQSLAELLDLCVVIEDASTFTGSGWKGRETSSIIRDVITSASDSVQAEFGIVVLDEIDKVFANNSDNPSFPATNNFLKLIEGTDIRYEENNKVYKMETDNLLFICLGAFDGLEEIILKRLNNDNHSIGFGAEIPTKNTNNIFASAIHEDLISYGVNPQFLGRMSIITVTNELSEDDFYNILTQSRSSIIKQYDTLLETGIGTHASITKSAARYIAHQAAKDNQTGARVLSQIVSAAFKEGLYKIGNMEDIRELCLDYAEQGGLTLHYIHGKRDKVPMPEPKHPELGLSEEDYKKVPLELPQYNPDSILRYSEYFIEEAELNSAHLSKHYSYRQLKSVVYLLAAVFLNTILSDTAQDMYSIEQTLQGLAKKSEDSDEDIFDLFLDWKDKSVDWYSKSQAFEADTCKMAALALSLLEKYCTQWLEKQKQVDTED